MGTISIVDQNGSPVGGIDIALERADELGNELWRQYPDLQGHTDFYYSALGVVVHNNLPSDQRFNLVLNRVEGLNPNWKDYEQGIRYGSFGVHTDLIGGFTLKLNKTATQCPPLNDRVAIIAYFNKVAASVGAHTNTEQNRVNMMTGISTCGWMWQNQLRPPMRARVYFPPLDSNGASGRWMNTGDENGPFVFTFIGL